ncbi:hypothetical protein PTKIN_Ptkin10aG0047900 [Pterospermum kingtungense]
MEKALINCDCSSIVLSSSSSSASALSLSPFQSLFSLHVSSLFSLSLCIFVLALSEILFCSQLLDDRKGSAVLAMDFSRAGPVKDLPVGLDEATEEEYASQSKLLQEFTSTSSIYKAWTFKSDSGSKLLIIRNPENESRSQFEIWSSSQLQKEFQIPQSVHGSVYANGWFEGISWNSDESLIAYVAEEPSPFKPSFDHQGYKKGSEKDKECSSWKGQGDWEEKWGECYSEKRQPAPFVINLNSGKVQAVKGIAKSLSVGQVAWAPPVEVTDQYLIFVGWSAEPRKLGMKYCYNRPCALYAVKVPIYKSEAAEFDLKLVAFFVKKSLVSQVYFSCISNWNFTVLPLTMKNNFL